MIAHVPRIISAVVGLALVGVGAWLCVAGHSDTGALVLLGGCGTLGLPSALPLRAVPDAGSSARDTLPLLAAAAISSTYWGGCSAGPQLPVVTIPVSVTCSWSAPDGGSLEDCDCLVDRVAPATETRTTGNDSRGARVDARVDADVTAR